MHIVYRVTNLINGKYYVGYHKTDDPNDSYLGSGTVIRRAIAKYGVENFQKKVLHTFSNAKDAFAKEKELVQQCLNDPLCYNLNKGGHGGFDYILRHGLIPKGRTGSLNPHFGRKQTKKCREAVAKANQNRTWSQSSRNKLGKAHTGLTHKLSAKGRQQIKTSVAKGNRARVWSQSSKDKLAVTQQQLRWIHRGGKTTKISASKLSVFLAAGWAIGRNGPVTQRTRVLVS